MHHARRTIRALALAVAALQLAGLTAVLTAGHAADAPASERSQAESGQVAAATSGAALLATPVTAASEPAAPATAPAPPPPPPDTTTTPPAAPPPVAPTTPPPSPPPPARTAPAPAPAPAPAQDLQARVEAAYASSVPAAWRQAIPVRLEVIPGATSWARSSGVIQVSETHARGSEAGLRATVAHEFGHLIAFRYGSQRSFGAAPVGWPPYSNDPAEAWADCVARAMTGIDDPSHGLPSCVGASWSWTAGWLGEGPTAHPRTG